MSELTLTARRDALRAAMAIIAAENARLAEETPLVCAGYRVDQRRAGAAWERGTVVWQQVADAEAFCSQVSAYGIESRIVGLWQREEAEE